MDVVQARNSYRDKGILDDFLKSFWKALWASDMLEKNKGLVWLLSHKVMILLGEWTRSCGKEVS